MIPWFACIIIILYDFTKRLTLLHYSLILKHACSTVMAILRLIVSASTSTFRVLSNHKPQQSYS